MRGDNCMAIENENNRKLENILNKYKLSLEEKDELINMIRTIYIHDEFQRRMTSEFKHHGEITLGTHILEDTVVTYLLSKKHLNKSKTFNYSMDSAVKIAMLHDLYTLPWQNNPDAGTRDFFNGHGFRHPIESVINAIAWYPELFNDENSKIIIDGIVHHMFPLPVIAFEIDTNNKNELKNFELVNRLSEENIQLLIESSNRNRIGLISFSRSLYPEGRIVSLADKTVSINQIKNWDSVAALVTGHNKTLLRKK